MKIDKIVILIVFILVTAGVVGFNLIRSGEAQTNVPATQPLKPSTVGEFRGISLQLHNSNPDHPYKQYITEIAQTGANTICLVVTAYLENCSSTSLFIESRKTPTDADLKQLIKHSRDLGLRVILMPIVLLENPREGEWRGKISPENWDEWWEDYNNYILHYAYIAEETGVEVFIIGSELLTTEPQTERWEQLIKLMRGVYHGRLSYSANWDHYRPIKFWDKLDLVGMTTYYDLTGGQKPTVEKLVSAWEGIKKEILIWQQTVNRPILFTEVGWPNQETCAQFPWDYYRATTKPDTQAQANCFEAFFQSWINEKPVSGFLVWEWRNNPAQKTGPQDTSYLPCDKPALEVIKKYFQYPGQQEEVTVGQKETKNN